MVKTVSIIIVLLVLMINLLLQGSYTGFDIGYDEALRIHSKVSFSGDSVYGNLGQLHSYITLLLLIILVGKLIKKEFLSQLICITSLAWTLYIYSQIYFQKNNLHDDLGSYSNLLKNTLPLDLFCVFVLSLLLIYQLITVLKALFSQNKATRVL